MPTLFLYFLILYSTNCQVYARNFSTSLFSGGQYLGITNGGMQYYVSGNICFISCAIWGNIINPTDEQISLTLPFKSVSSRNFGNVGYHTSGVKDILVANIVGSDKVIFQHGTGGSAVRGVDMTDMTVQFSIVYAID